MLCNHIASSELKNQHVKDCNTANHAAYNWVKIKKAKIEAHKPIANNSQTLTISKETFTQPQPAGFTSDKEKPKADSPVCYNCGKVSHIKRDCPEPQRPGINNLNKELHGLEEDLEKRSETENSRA